jgi:hypothetical protein
MGCGHRPGRDARARLRERKDSGRREGHRVPGDPTDIRKDGKPLPYVSMRSPYMGTEMWFDRTRPAPVRLRTPSERPWSAQVEAGLLKRRVVPQPVRRDQSPVIAADRILLHESRRSTQSGPSQPGRNRSRLTRIAAAAAISAKMPQVST